MHVLLLSVYQAIFYSGEIKHTTLPLKDTVATEPLTGGEKYFIFGILRVE